MAREVAEGEVKELRGRLRDQGEKLEGVWQELMRERLKVEELELARKKWEERGCEVVGPLRDS